MVEAKTHMMNFFVSGYRAGFYQVAFYQVAF